MRSPRRRRLPGGAHLDDRAWEPMPIHIVIHQLRHRPAQPATYDRWAPGRSRTSKGSPSGRSDPPKIVAFRIVSCRSSRLPSSSYSSSTYCSGLIGELAGSARGNFAGPSSAAMGSLGGGCRTELPRRRDPAGGIRWWVVFYLAVADLFHPLLLLMLQVAAAPGPAARSGFRRWMWRSRSLRPRRRRSSRPPVRCPLSTPPPPAVTVVPLVFAIFGSNSRVQSSSMESTAAVRAANAPCFRVGERDWEQCLAHRFFRVEG